MKTNHKLSAMQILLAALCGLVLAVFRVRTGAGRPFLLVCCAAAIVLLLAARKLGCTPEECIVVGDSPADVFAASAAGMDVYLIPDQIPANPDTRAKSRQVLNSLEQLLSAMEEDGCVTN